MINKPQGYDTTIAFNGENTALPVGGYVCKIIKAIGSTSTTGKPLLILLMDIAEGEYKGYFDNAFKQDERVQKRWGCVYRQLLTNPSVSFLKGMVTAIERSNNFAWDWEENTLKGKLIGMVFGREQYKKSDGKTAFSVKPLLPRTVDKIRAGTFEVPADKLLTNSSRVIDITTEYGDIPSDDGDLPF